MCEYFVPAGNWIDFQTSRLIRGGSWHKDAFDFHHLPLLLREDAIVPVSPHEDRPRWAVKDELTLHVGYLTADANCAIRVPCDEGPSVRFSLRRTGNSVRIESDLPDGKVAVLLRAMQGATRLTNGRSAKERPEGLHIEWADPSVPLTFELRD
jgi:alpha-D-xyloside xylohydrolase